MDYLESVCALDIFDDNCYFENFNYDYYSENNNISEMITEASNGTSKKNIFQKLFDLIKKIIRWICDKFKLFINWVKKLFNKKGPSATVDQCIENITNVSSKSSDSMSKKKVDIIFNTVNNDGKYNENKDTVELMFKNIKLKFDKKSNSIGISVEQIDDMLRYGNSASDGLTRQSYTPNIVTSIQYTIVLMREESFKDHFTEFIDTLVNYTKYKTDKNKEKMIASKNIFDKDSNEPYLIKGNEYISLDKMVMFQQYISDIQRKLEIVDTNGIGSDIDNKVIDCLNNVLLYANKIQYGLNAIMGLTNSAFLIDAKYHKSIKTPEQLGEFVNKMISAGMSAKTIAYNSYLSLDDNMNSIRGDKYNPIWGQSRAVFFPNDKSIVYKIALSGNGQRSGKAEETIYNYAKTKNLQNDFAEFKKSYADYSVTEMERVETNKYDYVRLANDATSIRDKYRKLENQGFRFRISSDLHAGNIGYRTDEIVIIDYGYLLLN